MNNFLAVIFILTSIALGTGILAIIGGMAGIPFKDVLALSFCWMIIVYIITYKMFFE